MKIHHIKLLFCIFALLVLQTTGEAKSQYSDALSKMEKALFNMDYSSQSDEIRLKRMEENVYGVSSLNSTKPMAARINKLSKDISADVIGQEIKPKKDSFLAADEIIAKEPDEDMDFTLVNNLEQKVFHYEFKTVDLDHRLSALEGQVLKKNYATEDLSTRIRRLNDVVLYHKSPIDDAKIAQTPASQQKLFAMENKNEEKLIPIPNSIDKQEQVLDPNIKLLSLEKSVFAKSFPNEKIPERLSRLETKVLCSTFPTDDEQTRLNRIDCAYQAKGSAKLYNGNKTSKLTATAIEVGTILLMLIPLLL